LPQLSAASKGLLQNPSPILDQYCASFETPAARAPQDEVLS